MAYNLLGFKPAHPCASGTTHTDGASISASIREQHRRALDAYPGYVRRNRSPREWARLYREAMEEKRKTQGNKQSAGPLFD